MSTLYDLGIVKEQDGKAAILFQKLFPNFIDFQYVLPSEYVKYFWSKYKSSGASNNNLNGLIFEYILSTLAFRENLLPMYLSANVAFVPNVNYDIMFYTSEFGPLCLSAKTSLRERYKQADLEAIVLKNVHRRSKTYLITLDKIEAARVKQKVTSGEVIGFDNVVLATSDEFDKLIAALKNYTFIDPPMVRVMESSTVITKTK